ncbi:MAG: cytochrome d ubiquinol oxidase subunit II [Thermoleophilia bacterium]|jgi:cytochrome d ubiquinol oxidase subunit II|nr:cytochrome d ubiquinol oxidase subunit II [Thermoleophilia bacterium]
MTLADVWFVLVAVLLTGYAALDGFDLGAGVLYPFLGRTEEERATIRSAIGPVWDGNEVFLVVGGGALFAAFPPVYAMTFSGFYLAIMLFLFGLIFRAVSMEFHHRDEKWARVWDAGFFVGSLLPALLAGVALGNVIRGVPLDANGDYAGSFLELLNPYSLLIGVTGLALFATHGAAWIAHKSEGVLQRRAARTRLAGYIVVLLLAAASTVVTFIAVPRASDNVVGSPVGWAFIALLAAAALYTLWQIGAQADLKAFLGTTATIIGLAGVAAVGNYPDIVPARDTAAETSLTVANSSSSDLTLTVMLVVAVIGVPLVTAYTIIVYRTFTGKAKAGEGY